MAGRRLTTFSKLLVVLIIIAAIFGVGSLFSGKKYPLMIAPTDMKEGECKVFSLTYTSIVNFDDTYTATYLGEDAIRICKKRTTTD